MKHIIFYLGVGLFFTHELDAMVNKEWLVLPLTSWLPDAVAKLVFVLAHIPLFAVLVALLASKNNQVRNRTEFFLAAFWLIHGVLHALFVNHKSYEFASMLSNILIFGAAICGFLFLLINIKTKKDNNL